MCLWSLCPFDIINSTFSNSHANYGGSIYSKIPSKVRSKFKNNNGMEGGAIYFGCSRDAEIINSSFEDTQCSTHGGAVYFNRIKQSRVYSSIFTNCYAPFGGGAVGFILHPAFDSDIDIGEATVFKNNSASIGSAIFLSQHKIMTITDTEIFMVSSNASSINTPLNTINVDIDDAFSNRYVFAVLLPTGNTTMDMLEWNVPYQWNDDDIQLLNDFTPYFTSKVDDSRFISPLFIPLKLETDDEWTISNAQDWNIELNFINFFQSLSNPPSELTFKVFLVTYKFLDANDINSSKAFKMNMNDAMFIDNYANVLSTVYINEDAYHNVDITMNDIDFKRNIAPGLTSFAVDHYGPNDDNDEDDDGTRAISCDRCNFEENIAYSSAACLSTLGRGSSLSCSDCTFSSNSAKGMGAAVYTRDGSLTLTRSKIKDNDSPLGSNVLVDNAKLFLRDSIFDRNTAIHGGGAAATIKNIHELIINKLDTTNYDDLIEIDNCSFTNHLGKTAGTIYMPITDNSYKSSVIARRLMSSAANVGRRLLQTTATEPVADIVMVQTQNGGLCDGLEIVVDADFHSEDVSWIIQFDDDTVNTVNESATYGCISYIPSNVECVNVTILDKFGDGLNYGDGGYTISWNNKYWESPSLGNYGESETLILCPSTYDETDTLTVFVQIEDNDSLQFLEFLDDELVSLMDDTISYNVIFDIQDENIADNATCLDCKYGYCVCDVSTNITMENVIAALCYLSTPALRNMYNYTWDEFWGDDIDFDNTTIDDFCLNDAQTLLDDNYMKVQEFATVSAPAFYIDSQSTQPIIIAVSPYLNIISNVMSSIYSNCDLYSELYDIIDPICYSLNSATILPALCQSIDCYSSYCNTTQALLSFAGNKTNGYKILNYKPYSFDGIVGSSILNIKHSMGDVYGIDEYFTPSLGCFNGTQITKDLINNTIPVLAVHLNGPYKCNYIDLISTFQSFGARAVILVTDIIENSDPPTPSPTIEYEESALNYNHWLPFDCDVQFQSSITNYSAIFLSVVSQIDAKMANVFETNIRGNESDVGSNSILYRFDANTTYNDLSVPNTLISEYLSIYLQLQLFLSVNSVQCQHGTEINESYSNAPTPQPTHNPTTSPTDRSIEYDGIYIPIELVTLSYAVLLTQVASDSQRLEIGFLCETLAPTPAPSPFPTESPTPNPTPQSETVETDEFVISVYSDNNATRISMGISFPNIPLESFLPVYDTLCNFPFDDEIDVSDEYVYYVTVDTVFNEFESICVELNDDSNTMITAWTQIVVTPIESSLYFTTTTTDNSAEHGCASNMTNLRTNIATQQRGTYCIAIYTNKDKSGGSKRYNLRIKPIFDWTPSFITIQDSEFINNTITEGKGGAITITTDADIYEFTSIYINDTIFDSNYAALGGGAIYRGLSESDYDEKYIQMSILEMDNIEIYSSIAQNSYGGSIMTELFTTETDGLIFRNAISITNMILRMATTAGTFDLTANLSNNITFGSIYDGFGGGIYARGTNLYIGNSDISEGYAWDGGCIWLKDTSLTLYESQIRNCTASNDGGGLKLTEYTKYSSYDICLSAYYTDFIHNLAETDGGGAYLRLHGGGIDATAGSRESCVKVLDVNFVDNDVLSEEGEGESVYLFVTDGHHDILDGDNPFSVVCEGAECITAGSTLNNFCASTIVAECLKYSRLANENYDTCTDCSIVEDYIANVTIADIPGSSVTFYVFGWDAFDNDLNTSEYKISVDADKATIITPEGTPSIKGEYYIVPLVINIGEKDAVGTITLYDQNGVAEPIDITLRVKECDPGYYQNPNEIDPNLFSCELCDYEQYTLLTDKCRVCEQGLFCYGGDNIWVEENWYAKQGISDIVEIENDEYNDTDISTEDGRRRRRRRRLQNVDAASYVTTALCPPGYCCNGHEGCDFKEKDSLCAVNRDPDTVLCGKCADGFSETLSSTGVCSNCEDSNEWLIVFVIIGGFAAIYFFYFLGHRERTVPHPFMTYCSKTLLFFYQVISFLTFRSSSQILRPLAELANLNWDVSKDGTCLFQGVTARGKLWLNLIVPGIIIFDMLIFYLIIRIRASRKKFGDDLDEEEEKKKRKDWLETEWIAFESSMWAMFLIIYVQITTAFIKLSMCYQFGDGSWHMWYAGSIQCFDVGHGFCMLMSFILVFCVPYIMLRGMKWYRESEKHKDDHDRILASLILSYRDQCWYYSAFNIFRRAILIVLPLIPTNDLSIRAAFITFSVGLLLSVHCYLMPFKWSANNHLETFILIISFFISTLNIVDDPPSWFPILTAILALSPFLPCIVLFHDFAKLKAVSLAEKLPELSFVWESSQDINHPLPFDGYSDENQGRTTTMNESPTDGEGGIQMTVPKKDKNKNKDKDFLNQVIDDKGDGDFAAMKNAGSMPTSIMAVNMEESDDEESKNSDPLQSAPSGHITQNSDNIEDSLAAEIPFFGGKKLKIYSRKRTTMDESKENLSELPKTRTTRDRRRSSVFLNETIRETKFGAERAWLPGSAPAWLIRWVWKEKYDAIEDDMLVTDKNTGSVALHKAYRDEENMNGLEIEEDVINLHKQATDYDDNDIDYYLDDVTIQTHDSWTEHDGVLLPPSYDDHIAGSRKSRKSGNKNRRHSGLASPPLTLFEVQNSGDLESDEEADDFMSDRRKTIKKSRFKITKQDTIFNIIRIEQKPWMNSTETMNETNTFNNNDDVDENSKLMPLETPATEHRDSAVEQLMAHQHGIDTDHSGTVDKLINSTDIVSFLPSDNNMDNYVIPNEYLYIDGLYSPKIFDEKFKSMVYAHNNNKDIEMRVLSHDVSDGDGISTKATWIIVDIKKKEVIYQSDKGISLYKPPIKGWKRLVHENEYHSKDDDEEDLNVDILEKDLKYGFIPAPQIINLSRNTSEAITVEYDYKGLTIPDAPNLQQWVEIIAHNITYPDTDEIYKIVYIKKDDQENQNDDNKEEKKDGDDDGLTASQRAWGVFEQNTQILSGGGKMKKLDWIRAKFEFDELGLEQKYRFTIKLSNCITFTESILSEQIMPMTLPQTGNITNVRCDSYKSTLFINYNYPKRAYENKSMNPLSFNIIITPWPGNNAFDENENNYYVIDDDNKKIVIAHSATLRNNNYDFEELIISNIIFGQEYNIQFEAENEIGNSISETIKYCPVRVPPKPFIDSIETDDKDWKMTINVTGPGYNDNDCRAWYELELIDPSTTNQYDDDDDDYNETKIELMSDVDEDGYMIDSDDEKKQENDNDDDDTTKGSYESRLDPGILEILKRKHKESPIIIEPIFAGQKYIVKVKCVNICAFTESDEYHPIILRTAPPKPTFTSKQAFDGSVVVGYKCPNYQYYVGFEPQFEIRTTPHHKQHALTILTKQRIDNLRNGWDYSFRVRAKNKLGESDWSNNIKLRPLKKPQKPIELRTVSGNKCITVLWLSSDNMEEPDINGTFVIISDPPTIQKKVKKNKVEFQALDNDKHYRFKVTAINNNFKIESEWTSQTKPDQNKERRIYQQEKSNTTDEIMKIRRKKLQEEKKKLRSGKSGQNTPTISTKLSGKYSTDSAGYQRIPKTPKTPTMSTKNSTGFNTPKPWID